MSFVKLLLAVPDSATTMKNVLQLNTAANQFDVEALDKMVGDMIDGALLSYTKLSTGSVQATATVTFTGLPTATETMTIANVTLTAVAGAPAADEFQIGADATETATNLAAAINASANLSGIAQATSTLGVVTVSSVQPGKSGNGLEIAESLSNATATAFANGSDGDQVAVNFGRPS